MTPPHWQLPRCVTKRREWRLNLKLRVRLIVMMVVVVEVVVMTIIFVMCLICVRRAVLVR